MKPPSAVVWGVALSAAFHVGAAVGIKRMPPRSITKTTVVSVVETKKKPKPKEEQKKEPPKPDEPKEPKAPPIVKAAPKPVAPPPPAPVDAPPPPPPVANANPNGFAGNPGLAGLQNVGMMTGGGGLAIPVGAGDGAGAAPTPSVSATTKNKEKVLGAAPIANGAAAMGGGDDGCAEEVTKPKPTSMPQPSYSDEARSAEIEGVVTVRVRVDASGKVVEATVTKPLGHGLDERAVAAAKSWTFSPGTKCGKPAESKFVMNMRFALGE